LGGKPGIYFSGDPQKRFCNGHKIAEPLLINYLASILIKTCALQGALLENQFQGGDFIEIATSASRLQPLL